ncbi:MAG: type II secretion system GspH family protein [Turicibacter sp.]|nr:type II secretion system GspH family protein [Turicibacter sp.]
MKRKFVNNSHFNNQKAFTLIEALIALSITGIIYLISVPAVMNIYDYLKLNQATALFQSDLHYIREHNMMPFQNNSLSLRIYHKENYYVILKNNKTITLTRQLPIGVNFGAVSTSTTDLTFNKLGHISNGTTLTIQSGAFKKNIVFSIGTGGIDIREVN